MRELINYSVTLAILAVLGVLIVGLWTMMRGKSNNLSQNLMRWRVGLQFVAVILIMLALYIRG